MKLHYLLIVSLGIGFSSCFSNRYSEERESNFSQEDTEYYDDESEDESTYDARSEYSSSYDEDTGCNFDNGTYSATVDYYNPETGHSATYTLDVEVEDCQVTVIYFPNGGWLDDSHINPDDLDESGYVSITGEEGKTYEVQID